MTKIECIKFRPHLSGSLIGWADFKVPKWGIILQGCGVFEKGDKRWVGLPSRAYQVNGETKYEPIMAFIEEAHAEAFKKILHVELQDFLAKQAAPVALEGSLKEGECPF